MAVQILQVTLILFIPFLTIQLCQRYKTISFFSPIVLCFGIGILIRNLNLIPVNEIVSGVFRDATVLYALPLLLFSSDVKAWIKHSKRTLFSYALAVSGGLISVFLSSLLFKEVIADIWIPAGMIGGIHTGGTPNLFAVGMALGAEDKVFTLANSAQILWGAINLFFMLSIGQKVYGLILKPFESSVSARSTHTDSYLNYDEISKSDTAWALLLVSVIVATSVALSYLVFQQVEATLIIVFITTASIMCSFNKVIRNLKGPFELGDYFLLMFGVAVGMMSDFRELVAEGGPYILYLGCIMILTLLLQVFLSKLTNIDTDTFIVTSTAAIYGPVFIPQVTNVLKNKSLLVGGIAVSLIGLAIGNYIGIGLAHLVRLVI